MQYLGSRAIAAWSCGNVVLGSRVKLAVRPSEDVTFIFLEAGGEEEEEEVWREGVTVGWGGVVVVVGRGEVMTG